MIAPEVWARAYARQAKADFDVWSLLEKEKSTPASQALHSLQMACEKAAKQMRSRRSCGRVC